MDRKGIAIIAAAVVMLIGQQMYFSRRHGEIAKERQAWEAANPTPTPLPAASAASGTAPTPAAVAPAQPGQPATPVTADLPEAVEKISSATADYVFTSKGGGIKTVSLKNHFADGGRPVVMNEFGNIPLGAIAELAGQGTDAAHTLRREGGAVIAERTDGRQFQITKKYLLPDDAKIAADPKSPDHYLVRLEVTWANKGTEAVQTQGYFVHAGSATPLHYNDLPSYTGLGWQRRTTNKFVDLSYFQPGFFRRSERPVYTEPHDDISWVGVSSQYFCTILTPDIEVAKEEKDRLSRRGTSTWGQILHIEPTAWAAAGHAKKDGAVFDGINGALGLGGFQLKPGESHTQRFSIYSGPREYSRLKRMEASQSSIMNFGWFGIISKILLNSLNGLKGILGNYAFAIIVLTVIIKSLMWPLQNKATKSMQKMSALQPEMTELRERYKDNPQQMNLEVMALYKKHKINPLGGCLPMLIQIPIFFGFYYMLAIAVELRNSSFLWVNDLSQPDTVAHLLGLPINPLPLVMAATMFLQMHLSPKSGDPTQQKIFMFMPLMFIFICYNFASALALYWTVQNIFSIVQLLVTRKKQTGVEIIPPAKKSR